jgi:ribosomal protein S27E
MAKAKKKKETKTIDIYSIKECPDCASINLVYNEERQQVICRDCGLIYEPMAPELQTQFGATHSFQPKAAAQEKIMVKLEEEKPKKVRKPRKAKKKPKKKKKAKPKKKAKKKAKKRKIAKKKKAKPKKKPAKKKLKKKAVKKRPAKKKAKPKKKPAKKKKSIIHKLRSRLKKKR